MQACFPVLYFANTYKTSEEKNSSSNIAHHDRTRSLLVHMRAISKLHL